MSILQKHKSRENGQPFNVMNHDEMETLHLKPLSFRDILKMQTIKKVDDNLKYADTIFSLIGKSVKEISDLSLSELNEQGYKDHAAFAESYLDAGATTAIIEKIMRSTESLQQKNDDKATDIGEAVKN